MKVSLQIPNRNDLVQTMNGVKWDMVGRVTHVVGQVIEAVLPGIRLGALVDISVGHDRQKILGEVVGFRDDRVLVLPYSELTGIAPGCSISRHGAIDQVPVGDYLLGHVVDPFLVDLMTSEAIAPKSHTWMDVNGKAENPMMRARIEEPLGLGVRAIDGLLTLGAGQRMGILAGSGVGKSVLMGMVARGTSADINVIGLIGERGREVREFVERDLGAEALKRSVVVTVTSDESPLLKVRAAKVVHSIAEYFSRTGKNVLLMMDSVSRIAMAQREVGLAVGEPPTSKGYTPSVFSLLPRLLERSGPQAAGCGSISGLYTVLADGDDLNDPIVDAVRSILDGQISLSRQLAGRGFFPAIDLSHSISRVMNDVVDDDHKKLALRAKQLIGVYEENFDLVQIGAYQPGANPELDLALSLREKMDDYRKQGIEENVSLQDSIVGLKKVFAEVLS